MLYDLGYKSGLDPNTSEISEPVLVISEGLVSLSVASGSIVINGDDRGSTTNALSGDTLQVRAASSSQTGVPRFIQLFQDSVLEGTFVLINKPDETFEYNDALNGKYAWEVLPESIWTASDNGSVTVIDSDVITQVPLVDKTINADDESVLRNRIHILDRYLHYISVFNFEGDFIGRFLPDYQGPVDSVTVFSASSARRILSAFAFLDSNKVVFYTDDYNEIGSVAIPEPIAVASVLNQLYIAQKNSNTVTVVTINDDGSVANTETFTAPTKPHRLYTVGTECVVLTETSLIFVSGTNIVQSLSVPAFASSMYFDSVGGNIFISHRHERRLTKVQVDFENGHTVVDNKFFPNRGYLDSLSFNRAENLLYVSDVVNKEIVYYDTDLNYQGAIPLDSHVYEMYVNPAGTKVIASSLYPDIDERLIISDGDPDAQVYHSVTDIPVGGTKQSPSYTLSGVREPVVLYLYPDDDDVSVSVMVDDVGWSVGKTINPGQEFSFEIALQGGKARNVNFVLGQSVYSFAATPELKRLIPFETTWHPIHAAEPDTGYGSNVIDIQGLDVDSCTMEVTAGTVIYKNGENVGTATTVSNGDQVYLAAISDSDYCDTYFSTVTWGNLFDSTWSITTKSSEPGFVVPSYSADFVDLNYAELGKEFISEPITVNTDNPIYAQINNDYSARLIINGQDSGLNAVISDGDSVSIALTTQPVFATEHQITLAMCGASVTWIVTTLPAVNLVPLNFGAISGLTLGDRVMSDAVNLDTIDSKYTIEISIPRNTVAYVNGVMAPELLGKLNYRGVLRSRTTIKVKGQSQIFLEGYALGPYGSTTSHLVTSGISKGAWSIQSIAVDQAIKARDLVPVVEQGSVEPVEAAQVYVLRQGTDIAKNNVIDISLDRESETLGNVVNLFASGSPIPEQTNYYATQMFDQEYSKANSPELLETGRDYTKSYFSDGSGVQSSGHIRNHLSSFVSNSDFRYGKSSNGISQIHQEPEAQKAGTLNVVSRDLDYTKSANPAQVVEPEWEYTRNEFEQPTFGTEADRYDYSFYETEAAFGYYVYPDSGFIEYEYDRNYYDIGKWFIQDFEKSQTVHGKAFYNEFTKSKEGNSVTLDREFEKEYSNLVANIDREWVKHHRSVNTTDFWLKVNTSKYAHYEQIEPMRLVKDRYSDIDYTLSYIVKVTSPNEYGTESSNLISDRLVHQEVSTYAPNFVSLDTFSFSSLGSKTVVINESDCAKLGNEACLDNGYFESEQAAIENATQVWGLDLAVVKPAEISPGCWIWSQKLPCVNSCYGCPSTGYIQGG